MTRTPATERTNETDWSIQQEIIIEAPVERVWKWLAHPEKVSQWWCPPPTVTIDFEPKTGGDYTEEYSDGDEEYHLTGTIVTFDLERRFAVRRETVGQFGPADVIEFDVCAITDGTHVSIVHSFIELPEARRGDAEEFFASGWNWSLHRLRRLVTDSVE